MNARKRGSSIALWWCALATCALAAAPPAPPPRWQPPPQGGIEMFRQLPRAFGIGPAGAGGEPVRTDGTPASPAPAVLDLVVRLAPQSAWDLAEGPTAHLLSEGTVSFVRPGEWRPAFVGKAGEPVALPPGRYWLMGDAPGYVTTASNLLPVSMQREKSSASFVTGVVPACRVELSPHEDWGSIERLDVVSLREGTVQPIAPGERTSLWVPVGEILAYTVREGRIDAVGQVRACRSGEAVRLPPPRPPPPGTGVLVLTLELPRSHDPADRRLGAILTEAEPRDPSGRGYRPMGAVWQEGRVTYFFAGLPSALPLVAVADDPSFTLSATPLRVSGVELHSLTLRSSH